MTRKAPRVRTKAMGRGDLAEGDPAEGAGGDGLGAIEREDLEPGGDAEATAGVVDGGEEREARARAGSIEEDAIGAVPAVAEAGRGAAVEPRREGSAGGKPAPALGT